MAIAIYLLVSFLLTAANCKVSLYLSSDQTEALYGIKTDGLFYVRDGMVNQYAMTFQHQVIPPEVDHIDFTWRAAAHAAVPYKMHFIHTPGPAMDPPTVNVSLNGLVPTYTDKFRLFFPCTGKISAEVDTLLQVSLYLDKGEPEILNFKRRKVCKERDMSAEELVSSPDSKSVSVATAGADGGAEDADSLLLASVSPTMFIAMGAASASVLLLAVLLSAVYLRRVRKRGRQLSSNEAGSLRSSIHLHSELDYTEKSLPATHLSSGDSYATLASFTKVPVARVEGPGWARLSSPSVADYTGPLITRHTKLRSPAPRSACMPGDASPRLSSALRPGTNSVASAAANRSSASLGSLQSSSLVYETDRRRVSSQLTTPLRPVRVGAAGRSHRLNPADIDPRDDEAGYQYANCDEGRATVHGLAYPDYEYSGEASPYSVSSELYKHVLPQYFQFGRPTSRGSVLV